MAIFSPPPFLSQRRRQPPLSIKHTSGAGTAAGTSTADAVSPAPSTGDGTAVGTSTATAVGASLRTGVGSSSGTSTAVAISNDIFPLSISSDGRYLKQNNGTPFLICADSTWSIAVNIPTADINTFLGTITGQGFNALMMNVIEHFYTIVKPPKERGGLLPFTKKLDGSTFTGSPNGTIGSNGTQGQFTADDYSNINNQAADWTFPNTTYWQTVETILNACLANNVLVFSWVAYVGFQGSEQGWLREMVALDAVTGSGGFAGQPWADNSKSKLWNYGAWLADRWKLYPNIIWVMGGDTGSGSNPFTTPQLNAVNNVMAGMRSVSGQASTLFTAHWDKPSLATDTALSAGSFDLNLAYCDEAVAEKTRSGYAHSPTSPTFLGEYNYESGSGGTTPFRKYLYWGFLGGVAGGFFGHEQLWRFDSNYATFMNTQGTLDASRQFTFWKSKPWWRLKPSGLGGMGTIVTAGGGTASPQSTTYVAAAATSEGDLLLAYVPPAHTGSVTIDMTKMSGTATARWFDPTNSTFTTDGTFSNTGTHAFTTPGNNNAGDADWLLVLETNSGTATGTSTATAVALIIRTCTGTSVGTSTVTATGQSTSAATGTSSGTGLATAVLTVLSNGSGTSSGSGTAVATGLAVVNGVGSSSGTASITAVGQSSASSSGTSSGSATVTSVGAALSNTTGTATGVATAVSAGSALSNGIGSSAGSGTATGVTSALVSGNGTSSGISVVTGVGISLSGGVGTAAGLGTGTASGTSTAAGTGTTSGTSTVSAVTNSLVFSTGSTSGTSTATAIGQALTAGDGVGSSSGISTAAASGTSTATGSGTVVGLSTVTGFGVSVISAIGTASGTGTASGVGQSNTPGITTGSSSGISTATAVGIAISAGVGIAAGIAIVTGAGVILVSTTGNAAGSGSATGVGQGTTPGTSTGSASGTSTATGVGLSIVRTSGSSSGIGSAFGVSNTNKPAFQVPIIKSARPVSVVPVVKLRRRRS